MKDSNLARLRILAMTDPVVHSVLSYIERAAYYGEDLDTEDLLVEAVNRLASANAYLMKVQIGAVARGLPPTHIHLGCSCKVPP